MSFSWKEQDVEGLPHFHAKLEISKYVLSCLEVGGVACRLLLLPFGLTHSVPQTKLVIIIIIITMHCHLVKFHYQFHGLGFVMVNWKQDHIGVPILRSPGRSVLATIGGVFRLHFIALSAKCRRRGDKIRKFSEEQWLEMRLVCATATSPHARNERLF